MKITQSQLRRIIKEELARIMEYSPEYDRARDRETARLGSSIPAGGGDPGWDEDLSDQATDIHATLENIAYWMQENLPPGTPPEEGVKAWLELAHQEGAKISDERRQALIGMASRIYDYM